jgi:hypothetical protein
MRQSVKSRRELSEVARIDYLRDRSQREFQLLANQVATLRPITKTYALLNELPAEQRPQSKSVPELHGHDLNASRAKRQQDTAACWIVGVLGLLTMIPFYVLWAKAAGGPSLDFLYQLTRSGEHFGIVLP